MKELQRELAEAVIEAAKVVSSTMGPHGRNAAMFKNGFPITSRDGVFVAKELEYEDPIRQMGAKFLADAANVTVQEAGDGTTTTCAIVWGMLEKYLASPDINVPKFIQSLKDMRDEAIGFVEEMTEDCDLQTLEKVATISANNDPIMGRMIAEVIREVGPEGSVFIEAALDRKNKVEVMDGYSFDGRPIAQVQQPIRLGETYVLLAEEKIVDDKALVPIYKKFASKCFDQQSKQYTANLICVVSDLQGPALRAAMLNFEKNVPVFFVKAPETGERRLSAMRDLEAITGARLFSEYLGVRISEIGKRPVENIFGRVESATIDPRKTTLFFGEDRRKAIKDRIEIHEGRMEENDPESGVYKFHQESISKLTSGVGVVYVGGDTETERAYTGMLWDDGIMAARGAIKDGVIPGLAATLYSAIQKGDAEEVFNAGMEKPIKVLAENSGVDVEDLQAGTNLITGEQLRDPARVAISSIKNAVSLVIQIIQTKYVKDYERPKQQVQRRTPGNH
jgi:chaperonin GroEL